MRTAILAISGGAILTALAASAWLLLAAPDPVRSPALIEAGGATIGGDFTLTSHTGARVTAREVIDGPTLVYFGYTFCPDICPIDVQVMVDAVEILEARGLRVRPVFVTVDPARDTPEAMAEFVAAMHPGMLGLTGTADEIRAAADAYKVYFQRVETAGSAAEYLMNHTAFTYFMLPGGVAAVFRNSYPPEEMAGEVERILRGRG